MQYIKVKYRLSATAVTGVALRSQEQRVNGGKDSVAGDGGFSR
jgi:hypothetical protein